MNVFAEILRNLANRVDITFSKVKREFSVREILLVAKWRRYVKEWIYIPLQNTYAKSEVENVSIES